MKDTDDSVTREDEGRLGVAADLTARRLTRASLAPVKIVMCVAAVDLVIFALIHWFAAEVMLRGPAPDQLALARRCGVMALGSVTLLSLTGGYRLGNLRRGWRGLLYGLGAAIVPVLAMLVVLGPTTNAMLTATVMVATLFLGPVRLGLAAFLEWGVAVGLTERRAILAGGGAEAEGLILDLANRGDNDIAVYGIFDDRDDERVPQVTAAVPLLGSFDELVAFCRSAEIDLILITLPPQAEERIDALLQKFRVLPQPVHLAAYSSDLSFPDTGRSSLTRATFQAERRIAKRGFDLIVASLALVVLSPVMILAALALRLDSRGPIFFRQERHGFKDRPIGVLKFRTMHAHQADARAERVVTRDDPRVTRVGRILRKTSIDELPQLFNVLRGDLSLVGPRPHAVDARSSRRERFARIVSGYSARHRLPPGITGWAQVNGWRGEIADAESLEKRVSHDLFYIENWSIWFDIKILLRTPLSLFDTRRAY